MHKFFTENFNDKVAVITGEDVKHAWKVLRLKQGDRVYINDLQGNDFEGVINEINKQQVIVDIISKSEENNESPVEITVIQGIPKGQKMELICQKVCELGASRVIPMKSERIIPDTTDEYKKLDRLKKIILEASKQSKRSRIMEITNPVNIEAINVHDYDLVLVPYEEKENIGINSYINELKAAKKVAIIVGPEGGFEEDEITKLEEKGAKIITLGPRILRTETCALSVISMIGVISGDMGGK